MKEYVGAAQIMRDWDVCKATAYNMIRRLNKQLLDKHPTAIIISGKVNRAWYDEACLRVSKKVCADSRQSQNANLGTEVEIKKEGGITDEV